MPKRIYSRHTINLIQYGLRNMRAGLNPKQPAPKKPTSPLIELPTEAEHAEAMERSIRSLRNDHRVPVRQFMPVEPRKPGNGWTDQAPLRQPPGQDLIERLANAMQPHGPKHGGK